MRCWLPVLLLSLGLSACAAERSIPDELAVRMQRQIEQRFAEVGDGYTFEEMERRADLIHGHTLFEGFEPGVDRRFDDRFGDYWEGVDSRRCRVLPAAVQAPWIEDAGAAHALALTSFEQELSRREADPEQREAVLGLRMLVLWVELEASNNIYSRSRRLRALDEVYLDGSHPVTVPCDCIREHRTCDGPGESPMVCQGSLAERHAITGPLGDRLHEHELELYRGDPGGPWLELSRAWFQSSSGGASWAPRQVVEVPRTEVLELTGSPDFKVHGLPISLVVSEDDLLVEGVTAGRWDEEHFSSSRAYWGCRSRIRELRSGPGASRPTSVRADVGVDVERVAEALSCGGGPRSWLVLDTPWLTRHLGWIELELTRPAPEETLVPLRLATDGCTLIPALPDQPPAREATLLDLLAGPLAPASVLEQAETFGTTAQECLEGPEAERLQARLAQLRSEHPGRVVLEVGAEPDVRYGQLVELLELNWRDGEPIVPRISWWGTWFGDE